MIQIEDSSDVDRELEGFDPREFFFKNFWQIVLVGMGIVMVGLGFFLVGSKGEKSEVEIITEEEKANEEVMIDVQGAVERPGVYGLAEGARVNDALIAAGGISAEADREFLSRYVNLAQKVKDGAKIYILKKGDKGVIPKNIQGSEGIVAGVTVSGTVDINTASEAELDKLSGIGPVTAQKIIEGRPYSSVEELLTKKILNKSVYEKNKDKLVVF